MPRQVRIALAAIAILLCTIPFLNVQGSHPQ